MRDGPSPGRRRAAGDAPPAAPADTARRADGGGAVRVRAATPADLDVVVALRLALLRTTPGNLVYGRLRADAPSRARTLFAQQLASTAEATFLAELPGARAPVGILRCLEGNGSPLLDPPRYAYVASVYVEPAARRRGVLRALFAAAEGWARAQGLDEMRLHTAADNAEGMAAWRALGFAVAEHLHVRRLDPRTGG